ncbi:hypothetical protein HanOQP8_Chr02g0049221 [Helianthus annuus]|nr:hypothetical protein HanOQP8_Chr02g0049221 [Helianthus annuus]
MKPTNEEKDHWNVVVPRLKSWIRKVVNEDVEENDAIKLTKNRHLLKKLLLQQKWQQQQHLMWHVLARRCWH